MSEKTLLISYLTDNRRTFNFTPFITLLTKCLHIKKWKLLILTHTNEADFYINSLRGTEIDYDIIQVMPDNNYIAKIQISIHYAKQHSIPYIMKCDNDIFLKAQTLDFMIENLGVLDDPKHLTIGPVLTSGIPGVEYFCKQFLDSDAQKRMHELFLQTNFYNRDGTEYIHLNKHSRGATHWDATAFFNDVKSTSYYYKGVHPIRFNEESLQFLNDYIVENRYRFFENRSDLGLITDDDSPYLCNSIFCIKTETYDAIVSDGSLYRDGFDEVPLNKYAWIHNKNHVFVKNGFAIHMYYNWKSNHIDYEFGLCNKLFT